MLSTKGLFAPCVHDSCVLMIRQGGAEGDTRLRSVFVSLLQGNPLGL